MKRKSTKTVDAQEAAKGPDAKLVLMERMKRRIEERNDSSDSGEELLRKDDSDDAILRKVKDKRLSKDLRKEKQCLERAQRVAQLQQRLQDRETNRDLANAHIREEAERKKRAADPLEELPSCFGAEAKRPKTDEGAKAQKLLSSLSDSCIAASQPAPKRHRQFVKPRKHCSPLRRDIERHVPSEHEVAVKVAMLKAALDCDIRFVGAHNCLGLEEPLRAKAVSRSGVGWALHCVIHREAGVERAIDAVLHYEGDTLVCDEAWVCSRRH